MDYDKLFLKHGHSYGYGGYLSKENERHVHEEVCRLLKVNKWSAAYNILDVGSGVGSFHQSLIKLSSLQNVPLRYFQFQYYGIDSCKKVCEATTLKYGEFFQNIDALDYKKKHDYCVCLSTLGTDQDKELISKMVNLSIKGVVLEFFIRHPYLKVYNIDDMFDLLSPYRLSGFRKILNSYIFYLDTSNEIKKNYLATK